MLNAIEIYRDAGKKAAECQNKRDTSGFMFHRNCYQRALALEAPEDRLVASQSYECAWKDHRNVPAPCL